MVLPNLKIFHSNEENILLVFTKHQFLAFFIKAYLYKMFLEQFYF